MKKKSIIIAVSVIAVLGIALACSKENTKQNTENTPTPPASKSMRLSNAVYRIWQKSDSAYCRDTAAFMDYCNKSNYSGFMQMTNITSDDIQEIENYAAADLNDAYNLIGDSWCSLIECIPCSEGMLPEYGQKVRSMRRVIDSLSSYWSYNNNPDFFIFMDSCLVYCWFAKDYRDQDSLNWCLLNCNMRRALRDRRHTLQALDAMHIQLK